MSTLKLDQINHYFGKTKALDDINISLKSGEFVSVLGPSGCGKTTLLSILSGILNPSQGKILLNNTDITQVPPEKRNFGLVFQNYALFPNLNVLKNITYGLRGREWPKNKRHERANELLELTRLENFSQKYPSQLSGGQQQRVALARALAPKPLILLLDEPLSALDAQVRLSLGQELLRIQRQTNITTLMVTHDQQEALALADRIILMDKGRIVQSGKPEELYANPKSNFVAEFIGHMNIISLPDINNGKATGIRYEDVRLIPATEKTLEDPHTWTGKVQHSSLMGSFYRYEILLSDFHTRIYADLPRIELRDNFKDEPCSTGDIVAVKLPEEALRLWEEE